MASRGTTNFFVPTAASTTQIQTVGLDPAAGFQDLKVRNFTTTGTATFGSTATAQTVFRAADGTAAVPSYSFTDATTAGFYNTSGSIGVATAGVQVGQFGSNGLQFKWGKNGFTESSSPVSGQESIAVVGTASNGPYLNATAYGTGITGILSGNTARGTPASPTAVQSGDALVRFESGGYSGSGWWQGGYMQVVAAENFSSPTGRGTYIAFYNATLAGLSAPSERLRIADATTNETRAPSSSKIGFSSATDNTTAVSHGMSSSGTSLPSAPAPSGATNGSPVSIYGGPGGSTSGSGGTVYLFGGPSTEGAGGGITLTAYDGHTASATARAGGSVTITAGSGVSSGADGYVLLTAGSVSLDGYIGLSIGNTNYFRLDANGNVICHNNGSAIATNATNGFVYLSTCAGTPTGVPASLPTGALPIVIDSTNSRMYFYSGGAWTLTSTGAATPTLAQVLATGASTGGTSVTFTDADNIIVGTSTGTKIGTATTQKIGFFNATPVVQQTGSSDVLASLVTLGLRAASSNPPLDLGTGTVTAGTLTCPSLVTASNADLLLTPNGTGETSITGAVVTATGGRHNIQALDPAALATGNGGGILFGGKFTGGGSYAAYAAVYAIKENATDSNAAASLVFATSTSTANTVTERVRIDSSGFTRTTRDSVVGWSSATNNTGAIDTALSRVSAGVIGFGTGAAASVAGSWSATSGIASGNITAGTSSPGANAALGANKVNDGEVGIWTVNTGTGTAAFAGVRAAEDAALTKSANMVYFNASWTTSGLYKSACMNLHSGSSATNGIVMLTLANAPIMFATNGSAQANERFRIESGGHGRFASGLVCGWSSATDNNAALDTALSRDSAGVVDFGTGAAASTAGSWKATNGTLSALLTTATVSMSGLLTKYNNITTAGWSVPAIYGSGRSTAQTALVASVATYTVGASDGSFEVSANVNVTTSTTHNITVTCAYTDETNTAQTVTLNFQQAAGTILTAITNVTGAGPYEGIPIHIRCKASTAITIATAGTFTGITYNVEGNIRQIA